MAVSADDVRVVKDSLPMIREHLQPVSDVFYDNLFAIAPEMRGLFREDLQSQGMRFMSTLATIADMLDEPDELAAELDDLATAHRRLGVKSAHFAPMGSALLVTLGETLGSAFTPRLQQAWRAAYDHVAEEMIRRAGDD